MTYAVSADSLGMMLVTSDGKVKCSTWRSLFAPAKDKSRSNGGWLTAALLVIFNAESWIVNRAVVELIQENKKQNTATLAMRIQKIERAMTRVTAEKDTNDIDREVETQYDGRVITRDDLAHEGYENDSETRQCNFSQLPGKRGYVGIRRIAPAIPCLALCKIDEGFMRLRRMMLAENNWKNKYPPRLLTK